MKIKTFCASAVLAMLCFDVQAGALLKDFKAKNAPQEVQKADKASPSSADRPVIGESSEKTEINTSGEQKVAPEAPLPIQPANAAQDVASEPLPAPAPAKKIVGDPVVLRVNNTTEIRRSQILKELQKIPPQALSGSDMDPEALFVLMREQVLKMHLIVKQAKKAGIEKRKEYLDLLDAAKNEILARVYIAMEIAPKAQNESNLRARYVKYVSEFKPSKEYHLYHIYTKEEQKAKEAIEMLNKGVPFATVAKEKSDDTESKDKGGDAGFAPIDFMPEDVKAKILALKDGEYTKEYIKFKDGFFILKVDGTRMSTAGKFEDVKKILGTAIMQEEIVKMFNRLEKQEKIERFEEDGAVDNRDPKDVLANAQQRMANAKAAAQQPSA